ncbi:pseudouridine synthase [Albimonas pacifica]|uniref:Pseudouridine synthase n=1 Tax=Albimonas pacifica TaxID=1114924 RepID=A0A1I3CSW4_9RHOB|nr:pseudouridine synthase [Albimonas pacifica]SFH77428.1 23S rRNA pseudouridine2605 synthase [Albimonas pacifica]
MSNDSDSGSGRPPRGPARPSGKAKAGGAPRATGGKGGAARARAAAPAPEVPTGPRTERLARRLARAGVASRRMAEEIILAGRVRVNGEPVDTPAFNVKPSDRVELDGVAIAEAEAPRMWRYYKPVGLVTSEADEKGRPTVFERLPEDLPRVLSVGRLDLNSEGLLLLTNDGDLKRRLELPSTGWLRKYRVRVHGAPDDKALEPLRRGVEVEGERFQPMSVVIDRQQGANAWLTVGLREGRNREVRRALAAVGFEVSRLIRVSYGPFLLGDMEPGQVEEIRPKVLRDQLGLPAAEVERPAPRGAKPAAGAPSGARPGAEGAPAAPRGAGKPAPAARGAKPAPAARGAKPAPRRAEAPAGRKPGPRRSEDAAGAKPAPRRCEDAAGGRPARRGGRASEDGEAPAGRRFPARGSEAPGGRTFSSRGAEGAPSGRGPRSEGGPAGRGPRSEGGPAGRGPRSDAGPAGRGPRADGARSSRGPRAEGPRGGKPRGEGPSGGRGPRGGGPTGRGSKPRRD